jgi:hypothetical protein
MSPETVARIGYSAGNEYNRARFYPSTTPHMRPADADRLQEPKTGETASIAPAAAAKRGFLARKLEAAKESVRARTGAILGMAKKVANYDVGQGAKELGRKALDVGSMDVGLAARRGLMAAGLAGAMAAPAYAEDKPADAMVVSGAKTELVAGSLDAAPAGIVLAMADNGPIGGNKGTEGPDVPKPAPEAEPAGKEWYSKPFGIAKYIADNPAAAEKYGATKALQDSYFEYRRQLDEYRRTAPEKAASFEKAHGEVVSTYVIENRFRDIPYPENVVDEYNRAERVDKDSLFLGQFSTAEGLQKNLPRIFAMGLSREWAQRQYERRNPHFVRSDGTYEDQEIRGVAIDAKNQLGRWKEKLFSESATRAGLPQKAADAMAQLDRLYAAGNPFEKAPKFNPFAVTKERVAVLSWVAVTNGFGGLSPDPVLRQGDLATLSIAYAAREDSKAMWQIPVLHIGRAVGMDDVAAKAKALLPAGKWDDLLKMSKPAGEEFAFGGREHLECALSFLRDDVEKSFGVTDYKKLEELRKEIRTCLARSVDVPLVDADLAMAALENLRLTGAKGSDRWKEDRKDVGGLIPGVFANAMGIGDEVSKEIAREKGFRENTLVLDAEGKWAEDRAAAMTKLAQCLEAYKIETDAGKRKVLAKEIASIIKMEREVRAALPPEKLTASLKKDLMAFNFSMRAIEKDLG